VKAVLLQMSWEWSTVQETVQKKKIWTTVAFGVQVPQTKVMTMNPVLTVFHKIDTNIQSFAKLLMGQMSAILRLYLPTIEAEADFLH